MVCGVGATLGSLVNWVLFSSEWISRLSLHVTVRRSDLDPLHSGGYWQRSFAFTVFQADQRLPLDDSNLLILSIKRLN